MIDDLVGSFDNDVYVVIEFFDLVFDWFFVVD